MDKVTHVNPNGKKKLLRDIRKQLGLSQQQMAAYLQWEQADLSRLETGKRIPDWLIRAMRLNDLLKQAGLTMDDLALSPPKDDD